MEARTNRTCRPTPALLTALVASLCLWACTESASGGDSPSEVFTPWDGEVGAGVDRDGIRCSPDFGGDDACGGELSGTWRYVRACSDFDFEAALQQLCPTATVDAARIGVDGSLNFASAFWNNTADWRIDLQVSVPASCAALVQGCGGVRAFMRDNLGVESASCTGSSDCSCEATYVGTHAASGAVTTDGGVASVVAAGEYWYCNAGETLTYQEIVPDGDVRITFVLTR